MNRQVLISLGVLAAFPCLAMGADPKADDPAVHGTGLATSAELAGKAFPPKVAQAIKLTLKEGKYEVVVESPDSGTVTYDNSADPKAMEIKGVEGPNKGKTFLAIYKLSGDKLTICYDLSGKDRPTEFTTRADTKLFLVIYERQKP